MKRRARADVVIVGAGIAGLWTRARLRRSGYSVVLLESHEIGAGQTIASQGILHRGVKYALSAEAREASDQLAAAQRVWRDGLAGRGEIDLSSVEVLADRMHLWATGLLGKATGVAAGLAMRSEVRRLERGALPSVFAESPASTAVWEVDEVSVSASSLVKAMRAAVDAPVVRTTIHGPTIGEGAPADRIRVEFAGDPDGGETGLVEIEASVLMLAAGAGNEGLLKQLGADVGSWAQRRALHMVLMDDAPGPLFAHMPRPGSDKPRLTVTSARTETGWCWYIGGDVAETGVGRTREEQIAFAKGEIAECLGWLDVSRARWAAFRIDRAEGKTADGRRPDGPVVRRVSDSGVAARAIAVWPTKLALAPIAAGQVMDELERLGVKPSADNSELDGLGGMPEPEIASSPWAWKELVWS